MTRRGRREEADQRLLLPSPDPLLLEHRAIRARFVSALRRRAALGESGASAAQIEEETATALVHYLAHLRSLAAELERRGIGAKEAEAAYREVAPDSASLDPSAAFSEGAPGGARGAGMVPWRKAAQRGGAAACYVAAMALRGGAGSGSDLAQASRLLEAAVQQSYPPALSELALLLLEGSKDPTVLDDALALLQQGAETGDTDACWSLALRLLAGRETHVDISAGLSWLERAAEGGHAEAQVELGRIHASGALGLPADHALALRWLTKAAAQHRQIAADWIEKYGALTATEYRSLTWFEYWMSGDLAPPTRAGRWGLIASVGLLALLVYGAARGNGMPVFLLILFLAVVIHEAGHWLAARLVGIPILVFTVGAGPLVRSFTIRGKNLPLRLDVKLLPLLGSVQPYVMPKGVFGYWAESKRREREGRPAPPLPDFDRDEMPEPVYLHVSRPHRFAYLFGGLAANFLVAVTCLFAYERLSDEAPLRTAPVAGVVPAGSVAAAAGIAEGDRFLSVDGAPVRGFFDVQRRLAPIASGGAAAPLPDPPGRKVSIEIQRGGATVRLEWPTPPAPPRSDPEQAYGLLPYQSWRIARVQKHVQRQLSPGDEITAFSVGGKLIKVTDPGALVALRTAFASPDVDLVELHIKGKQSRPTMAPWKPRGDSQAPLRAPFELDRLREAGPRDGLLEVVATVVSFGWTTLVDLPRSTLAAIRAPPTPEEKGWLLDAMRRDPWDAIRVFALLHALLLFLNLVPLPPLDGFHLLCEGFEAVARRPLPQRGLGVVLRIGWAILFLWIAINAILIVRDLAS